MANATFIAAVKVTVRNQHAVRLQLEFLRAYDISVGGIFYKSPPLDKQKCKFLPYRVDFALETKIADWRMCILR
jgi:hypothetical protein